MTSISTLSVSLLLAALAPSSPRPSSSEGELGKKVDEYVSRLERLGFSGAVILAREGEIELAKAYGFSDREGGLRTTENTVFPLGSITKHFTAAAILRLEMDESLSVEDPVEIYFEDWPADKAAITIHHLLSHGSGLPEASESVQAATSADDFIARCGASELLFPPGAGSSYSNLGYGLLAAIIERVSGTTWEEYLTEAVFEPAGMLSTGSLLPQWPADSLAHGYIDDHDVGTLMQNGGVGSWGLIGAGGLLSTVGDMEKWNRALAGKTILNAEALAKMTTVRSGGGFGMGYGCGIHQTSTGQTWFGHNGSNDVFSAEFRRYPEDDVFLFTAGNNADMYSFDFTPAIEALVFGGAVELPPDVVPLPQAELEAYMGDWKLPNGQAIEVRPRSGGLTFSSREAAAALLHPVRPGQEARRGQLIEGVESAFRAAIEGNFDSLHQLLDPYAPASDFSGMWAGNMDRWSAQLGELRSVRAVPGRNRFGEIALVAALAFEKGERKIEYSFGDREVGSIRLLDAYPTRVAYPESRTSFVSFELENGLTWRASFRMDEKGVPKALVLHDEVGQEFSASRD